jgi:hypothetical protein
MSVRPTVESHVGNSKGGFGLSGPQGGAGLTSAADRPEKRRDCIDDGNNRTFSRPSGGRCGAAGQGLFLSEDRKGADDWRRARARNQASGHRIGYLDTVAFNPVVLGHVGEGLPVGERLEQSGDYEGARDGGKADREQGETAGGYPDADNRDGEKEGKSWAQLEPGEGLGGRTSALRGSYDHAIRESVGPLVAAERARRAGCFREEPGLAVGTELGSGD